MIAAIKHLAKATFNRVRAFSPDPDIRANRLQLLSDGLPDPDFELFTFMDRPGLVVDAGANRGHCALAVELETDFERIEFSTQTVEIRTLDSFGFGSVPEPDLPAPRQADHAE